MDFEKVVMYGLNKKGLTSKMEIEEFNEIIDSKDISSPGVLKQRKKLRAEIYKDMMQNNLKAFYNEFTDEVKLFNYETYNKEELTNSQVKMIDNYIKDLKNPEINITKFMIKDDFYKTNENNTSGIYMKRNE